MQLKRLKYLVILGTIISISYLVNSYASFDPYNIDPVPEVTLNSQQPSDQQVDFRYRPVSLNEIPQNCRNGLISIEDKNFYSNIGVDLNGTIRGMFGEILNLPAGGSTLTQQLVKNIDGKIYGRSFPEKLGETMQALRLNFAYSKDQILEMYLNSVYFGHYNFGINAAAEEYFGKSVSELDLSQCAYLAGLPQAPSVYNPFDDPKAGIERQKLVLDAMQANGYITELEKQTAQDEPLLFPLSNH